MTAYDPAQWHDFCIALPGASGALLGLAFVAISFNLEAIIADKQLPGRAVETLIFFAYPLGGSLLALVPGLTDTSLGTGEGVLAAGLVGLVINDLPAGAENPTNHSAGGSLMPSPAC